MSATPVLPTPRTFEADRVPALRWGALGAGEIVGAFVSAAHAHTRQRVVAVAARSPERTAAFAARHGIEQVYSTPEALVADPGIDAVYIGTPHVSHRDLALLAIAAGKHVLVEKPLAMSATQGRQIVEAARAAGVFAMEAMWTRYLPQTDIVRQLLADGAIGEVDVVSADFGFIAPFDPTHRLWNPDLGGGALLDVGVYPVSFISSIIGPAVSITASGTVGSTGVDTRAALLLSSASGANGLAATSLVSNLPVRATIAGSAGRIEVHSPFFAPSALSVTTSSWGAEPATWRDRRFTTDRDGLSDEATAMAAYIGEGRTESPLHTLDETVAVLATLDEARLQLDRLSAVSA